MQVLKTTLGDIITLTQNDKVIYKISDISKCLGYTGTKLNRLCKVGGELIFTTIQTKGGAQNTAFINKQMLTSLLVRCKSDKSIQLAKELGIEIYNVRIESKEENTIMFVVKCFMDRYKMTRQFKVDRYRVDLYIHKLNLIVECDENDHTHYDKTKDQERTEIINTTLANPTWVRYNPDNDLSDVIRTIVNHQN